MPRAAILAFAVLAVVLVASDVRPAHANATQYGHFKAAYPGSPLSAFSSTAPSNSCLICHPTTSGPGATLPQFFNAYGTAYAAQPHATQSAAIAALQAIESANSDGDGPTITVNKAGTGTGTVTSSPGGINCGGTCTTSFAGVGSAITLTATPAAGSTFAGWSGGGTPACSGTGTCTVVANNITEINLGTFPGDAGSRPSIGVTATFTGAAFNYTLSNSGGITVTPGGSGATTITATLTAGATQSVSLLASGLPAGATPSFSLGACNPTCQSTLTITTTGATPTGTFPITVTGSPLGRTTMFNLVVNAPTPFDYSLTASGGITVQPGASGSTTITATLIAGATQSVSFAATGVPAGATPSFSLGACSPTCQSTLTISTTGGTAAGSYPITVTGSPLNRPTMFTLTVLAPGADLVVTELTAPTAGTVGGMIDDMSVTVRNQGSAVAGASRLGLYYSADAAVTTADGFSGFFCNIPSLNPGQSASCSGPIAVPGSLGPGTYHLGAIVDDLGQVPEASEQNNARVADTGTVALVAPGTSPLRLSLNKTLYAGGDLLSLTMATQPIVSNPLVDVYLVLILPSGPAYVYDGQGFALIYDGTNVFAAAVKPLRTNAPVTNLGEIVLSSFVPTAIPHGTYRFLAVLVRAGTNPLDTTNWLAGPSEVTFSF